MMKTFELKRHKHFSFFNIFTSFLESCFNTVYLEPIFSSPDIRKQMRIEAKRFLQVDQVWKDNMKETQDDPKVLACADRDGLLNRVMKANDQKVLMDYFHETFNLLSTPPKPPIMTLAQTHFDPPRSQRQIIADKRAERELEELENLMREQGEINDNMREDLQQQFDQTMRARTSLISQGSVYRKKNELTADERKTEDVLRMTIMSGAMSRRKVQTQVQINREEESRQRMELQKVRNQIINPCIEAAARGYSVAKSILLSGAKEDKTAQLHAFYGHGQANFSHANYPLLSQGPHSARMDELHPSNLRPLSKLWNPVAVRNIGEAAEKYKSIEGEVLEGEGEVNDEYRGDYEKYDDESGSSSNEDDTIQILKGLKRDKSRRHTESRKMGRLRLESAIATGDSGSINMHSTGALIKEDDDDNNNGPKSTSLRGGAVPLKPVMPSQFVGWLDNSITFKKDEEKRRKDKQKGLSLFFTSAWSKDLSEEERIEIMEANGYVYNHGEEELYGVKDDVSSVSGSVISEAFLGGKASVLEKFGFRRSA